MENYIDYKSACLKELRSIMMELGCEAHSSLLFNSLSAREIGSAYAQYCMYRDLEMLLERVDSENLSRTRGHIGSLGKYYSDSELKNVTCLAVLQERIKWQDRIFNAMDFLEIILKGENIPFGENDETE